MAWPLLFPNFRHGQVGVETGFPALKADPRSLGKPLATNQCAYFLSHSSLARESSFFSL